MPEDQIPTCLSLCLSVSQLDQIKILIGEASVMFCCGPMIGSRKCVLLNDSRQDDDQQCLHLKTSGGADPLSVCVGKSNKGRETGREGERDG